MFTTGASGYKLCMCPSDAPAQWSTLTLSFQDAPRSLEALALAEHRLESLGAALLEQGDVLGVEYRDARTFEIAERPTLVIYTGPEALDGLERRVDELVPLLGLPSLGRRRHTTDDDSWRDGWKAYFRPLRPGDGTLLVRPSWVERAPGDPEVEIVLDPGRAFGTGQHESTALCLELLARISARETWHPSTTLDLGCGSGILALAAARLWPSTRVLAVDIDPEAVETTLENAGDNQLIPRLEARAGTVTDIAERFDLVLANIRPEVLIPEAPAIARASRGPLILSGILDEELDAVLDAYAAVGLSAPPTTISEGGWSAVLLEQT